MRSRKCVVVSGPIAIAAMLAAGCGGSQPSSQPAPAPGPKNPPAAAAASAPAASSTPAAPAPSVLATPTAAAAASPPASAAAPAATPTEQILASEPFNENPQLRCDVLEVRRVSGGALLIRWRVIRPATQNPSGQDKGIAHSWGWNGVYFTDPVENKKYLGLKDSAGEWLAQGNDKTYGPGDQQMMWMKFPAPPPTSNKISFVFPGFPPFEDLPVS